MKILNLTQHVATSDQTAAGVVDLLEPERLQLQELLTFDELPDSATLRERAEDVVEIALAFMALAPNSEGWAVMIGGAPFFMRPLEKALFDYGFGDILYAFSRREVVEETEPDGSVRKIAFFRHLGFVRSMRS